MSNTVARPAPDGGHGMDAGLGALSAPLLHADRLGFGHLGASSSRADNHPPAMSVRRTGR
ncbi:hypothetical protein FHS43_005634 [Streptosporangium becharense]|uniref:Uncharacterized protein n=1 Tax=Streptosporangium becharense TaxID=1816182 RepID=A0A7W9MKE5_9ACTN|nr:hypothetical protein [Streptosporangium becharense]MBB2914322.1 hypothetical protein [Streptosporangium becharense]MBB5823646.1 hypothetical protein [Streptosporangium becharense]